MGRVARVLLVVVAAMIAPARAQAARDASRQCVVGPGNSGPACLAGFGYVAGMRVPAAQGCAVCCRDGDPACDEDGTVDGVCHMLLDLCADTDHADASRCRQQTLSRNTVHGAGRHRVAGILLPRDSGVCTAPMAVQVRRKGRDRGRRVLRLSARSPGPHPRQRQRSRLILYCSARPCENAWASASPETPWRGLVPASDQSWSDEDRALLEAADDRVATMRRREVTIRVSDASGAPRGGVPVEVWQTSRAFPIGTAVTSFDAVAADAQYLGLVNRLFNTVVTENSLKWLFTEPEAGRVDYGDAERWLAWADARGIRVKGTALVWGCDLGTPAWVGGLSPTAASAVLHRRIVDVLTRFRGRIRVWDAVNEPLHARQFDTLIGPHYMADVFRWAREVDPGATFVLNEYFPGADRAAMLEEAERFKQLVRERLFAVGVVPDAIGFEGHFFTPEPPPLEWTQAVLDSLAELGLPIHVTELDATMKASPEAQAAYYEGFLRMAFGHPAVTSILLWGFDDAHHWLGGHAFVPLPPGFIGAGIYDEGFRPKPAAAAVASLLEDRWVTRERGVTAADGTFRFQAFVGDYAGRVGARRVEFTVAGASAVTVPITSTRARRRSADGNR
jgi:endo-1,4-beta-xylanase